MIIDKKSGSWKGAEKLVPLLAGKDVPPAPAGEERELTEDVGKATMQPAPPHGHQHHAHYAPTTVHLLCRCAMLGSTRTRMPTRVDSPLTLNHLPTGALLSLGYQTRSPHSAPRLQIIHSFTPLVHDTLSPHSLAPATTPLAPPLFPDPLRAPPPLRPPSAPQRWRSRCGPTRR